VSWQVLAAPGSSLIPVLSLVVTIAAVAFGGLATWLAARRRASGKIGTSDAADLWSESRAIRDLLATQLEKVEQQRDRLIESQAGQVLPALGGLSASLSDIAQAIETIIGHDEKDYARAKRMERMLTQLVEGPDGRTRTSAENQGQGRGDRRPAERGTAAGRRAADNDDPDSRDGTDPAGTGATR
jgi:hypothetical protein